MEPATLFAVTDGVATLTLNRPQTRNALDTGMRAGLSEAVHAVRADAAIRALVIQGAGGAFCSGGDLADIAATVQDHAGWVARMHALHAWAEPLLTLDRPVVAAVDGPAFGAGFGLALAADFVLATPRARFCMSFLRVGLIPDLGSLFSLPRVVGVQRARELMLSAREVEAEEALRLGLVLELVPEADLAARAQALAASFVQASAAAVGHVKRALSSPSLGDLHAMLALEAETQAGLFPSDYTRDAIARFKARETPKFRWPR